MPDSIGIIKTTIKDKGVFDVKELYKVMKRWLDVQGYGDETKGFKEEFYVERIKGDVKQLEVKWRAEKTMSDYFSNVITIKILIAAMKNVEIEIEGKKIPTFKSNLRIDIKSVLVKDRQGKFKSDFFRNIYDNTIVRDRVDRYWGYSYGKTNSFIDEIKTYLELRGT
jgi:hypothetical protein